MELPGGAVVEAPGIGQQVHALSGLVAVSAEPPQRVHVPVQLPLHVKGIETVGEVVHALLRADLHVHRGANLQARKVLPHEPADDRRGRRDRDQAPLAAQAVDQVARALKKAALQTAGAVAVGVEQQVQADPRLRDAPKLLPLSLRRFPRQQIQPRAHGAAPAGHRLPGKIDLPDLLPAGQYFAQKRFVPAHLIADKQAHSFTSPHTLALPPSYHKSGKTI